MKIPNAKQAVVDVEKLRGYSLDLEHPVGKHKARLFLTVLGLIATDAETLREQILEAVQEHDAEVGLKDEYGQRYKLDFAFEWQGNRAILRSAWIVREGEDFPRLTTCYPLKHAEER